MCVGEGEGRSKERERERERREGDRDGERKLRTHINSERKAVRKQTMREEYTDCMGEKVNKKCAIL